MMGWFFSFVKLVAKIGLIAVGTFLLTGVAAAVLSVAPVPAILRMPALLLAAACFLCAFAVLLFGRSLGGIKWGFLIAFNTIASVFIIGILVNFLGSSPYFAGLVLLNIGLAGLILLYTDTEVFRTLNLKDRNPYLAIHEVAEIPRSHLADTEPPDRPTNPSVHPVDVFHHVLTTLSTAEVPLGVRLLRTAGRTRLFLFTWASHPDDLALPQRRLSQSLASHLPHFKTRPIQDFPPSPKRGPPLVTATLTGEPQPDAQGQGTTALAEPLLRVPSGTDAMVEVFATPQRPARIDRWFTRRRYERKAKDAHFTLTRLRHQRQESHNYVDSRASVEAECVERRLKRFRARHLLAVRITATCWSTSLPPPTEYLETMEALDQTSQGLLATLAGTIQSADPTTELEVKRLYDWIGQARTRLFHGNPTGPATLLTPEEAAPYFVIPRCDIGIPIHDRKTFYTATRAPGSSTAATTTRLGITGIDRVSPDDEVVIGELLRDGQPVGQHLAVPPKVFCLHTGIYGNPGSGKTTTALHLVRQLHQRGVPFLAIVPAKTEWRQLRDLIPTLRIFTAGDEATGPFRYNFFNVPPGVPVATHLDNVITCFLAAWPTEGILTEHITKIFRRTYRRAGWNPLNNQRGRAIQLTDLQAAAQEVSSELRYGTEMKQDFIGAFTARIDSLLDNPTLAVMFNTPTGLTIPDLLQNPTIIELRGLPDTQKALVTSLLTTAIAEYLEAQAATQPTGGSRLRHLLALEEAHRLLKRLHPHASLDGGHTAQQQAIDSLVTLLREARGLGLGVMLIDQLPSSLADDAVKLPGLTIIHHLKDADERLLVGRQANCDDDQLRHIGTMPPGEAILHQGFTSQAVNLHITNFHANLPKTRRSWTNQRVATAMKPFYDAHPDLRTQRLPVVIAAANEQAIATPPNDWEPDPAILRQLLYTIESPRFLQRYKVQLDQALAGNPAPAAHYLLTLVRKLVPETRLVRPYAHLLLRHLQRTLTIPHSDTLYDTLLFAFHDQLAAQEATHPAP